MSHVRDAIVIGAGPTGSIAAMLMARRGLDVVVVDKTHHPRHRIGESLLPRTLQILRELGLEPELRKLPHVRKLGAEFLFGHEEEGFVARFARAWPLGDREAFNIERAHLDAMMCRAAREAGAEVRLDDGVERIVRLDDGDVEVQTRSGPLRARWLVDCSAQSTVVGRHLGTRKLRPGVRRVAYFAIGTGVARRPDPDEAGFVIGVIHQEGWFWSIPLDAERTSVGVVLDHDVVTRAGVPANQVLRWAIDRSPQMTERCRHANLPDKNEVIANFTYSCAPWAGPGYFMVGDAATFVDPIFSTGVTLGMESARHVARLVEELQGGKLTPELARRQYVRRVQRASGIFFGLVDRFYDHSFRELFLTTKNPLGVRRAIITLLAGHAFEPPFFLRWRLWLLYAFVWLNRYLPLVPRRTAPALMPAAEPSPQGTAAE